MKRFSRIAMGLLVVAFSVIGCASHPYSPGWVTLIDGAKGLENFNQIGEANWRAEGGAIVADKGKGGYLVSKEAYKDFAIYAEFWAATDTNSGIFLRASNPKNVNATTAYECNVWDVRPDPTYGTGAIVDIAAVPVPILYKAGGQWNIYEIRAQGDELIVMLNGIVTAHTRNGKHASGPFALQYGPGLKGAMSGPIKWRKVQIKAL